MTNDHAAGEFAVSMPINYSVVLTSLGIQFPTIVVCIVGLVFAIVLMQRLPRAAALVAAGLGLILLVSILQPLVQILMNSLFMSSFRQQRGMLNYWMVTVAPAVLFNIVRAAAVGLLAWAAFVDRPRQSYMTSSTGKPWPPAPSPVEGKIVPGNTP